MRSIPVPSSRTLVRLAWVGAVLVVVFIITMLFLIARLSTDYKTLEERADSSRSDRDDLREWVSEQDRALAEANRKLVKVGERPVTSAYPPPDYEDLMGPAGRDGIDGSRGPRGLPGADGADGARGPQGSQGPRGLRGLMGAPGEDGLDGADGEDGADGADGKDGSPGAPGPAGPAGPPQSCESEFVCTSELQAAIANFITGAEVIQMLRALGCETSISEQGPNFVVTCTITGKP